MNYQQELEKACGEEILLIQSYDSDKKEVYHLAITMDGMEILETTPVGAQFGFRLGQSIDHQADTIKAARRAKDTIQAMNRAKNQMEQLTKKIGLEARGMKIAQESMG